ncbi:MAG: EamA family transporter [Haloplanus sp.]
MALTSAIPVQVLALVTALAWAVGPIVTKRGLALGGTSVQAAVVVIVVDSTLFWATLLGRDGTAVFATVAPATIGLFLVAGFVGTALARLSVYEGIDRVGASVNTAGVSTRPLFASVLALAWLGEPLTPTTAAGIATLVVGLVVLSLGRGGDVGGWRTRDLAFPLFAALLFAVGNVVRRFGLTTTEASVLGAVTLNETAAMVLLVGYALVVAPRSFRSTSRRAYAHFATTGVLTALGLLALFAALARVAGRVALVDPIAGTSPLITAGLTYVFLSDVERVTREVVVGAVLIVVGATLVAL